MIRLLLTLLALVTGLSASFSAADARVVGASEIAAEASPRDAGLAVAGRQTVIPHVARDGGARPCTVVMFRRAQVCAPAVQLRIDRAHE